MSLILIDNRVSDQKTVIDSLLQGTKYVIVDYQTDTLETLQNKIAEVVTNITNVTNVGIFQENYNRGTYQYIGSFTEATLTGVEAVDPEIATWTDFTSLLNYFKNVLNVTNLDLMGCNIRKDPNWSYVIGKLEAVSGLVIRSSDDYTGSSEMGGNWILESDNVDLIGTYFTESIKEYNFILGINSFNFIISENYGSFNQLYSIGFNSSGQLGNGTTNNSGSYVLASFPVNVNPVQISCGNSHTLVLTSTGKVYGCGSNISGELGIDISIPSSPYFVKMEIPEDKLAIQVSAGAQISFILCTDGTVYGCGRNDQGQLGCGDSIDKNSFTQMINPTDPPKRIVQVISGGLYVVVMMEDGSLYSCGYNGYGQLGNGTISPPGTLNSTLTKITIPGSRIPKQVNCAYNFTLILMTDNTIWGCGYNNQGQLGNNSSANTGSLVQMINNTGNIPKQIVGCTYVTHVLMDNNSIYTCGWNWFGQLMNGTSTNLSYYTLTLSNNTTGKIPINILNSGGASSTFIMSDGTVYQAGSVYDFVTNNSTSNRPLTQSKYSDGTFVTNASNKLYATILLSNASKTYDGNTLFGINNMDKFIYTVDYGSNHSNVQITSILGNTDSSDVGTNKALNISNITLNNSNYFTCSQKLFCNILRANLTHTVSSTKQYDGTNTAPLTLTYTGIVAGESPIIDYTATYNDINVGTRTVTVTNFQLQNSDSFKLTNYNYNQSPPTSFSGTITQRILTVTPTVSDKVYDGTNNSRSYTTLTFSNTIGGQTPVCDFTATYNDVDVGTDKNVTITNFGFSNNVPFLSGNYTIGTIPAAYGNIIAKELIVNIDSSVSKIYNGNNNATDNTIVSLSGYIAGETPSFSYTAVYDNANVGTAKTITVSSMSLTDNLPFKKNNYYITNIVQFLTGSITSKQLGVSITNIPTKIYDGNTGATISLNFDGLVQDETSTYNCVARYNNKFAGANKPVSITSVTLEDNGSFIASNYILGTLPTTTGTITRKILTVSVENVVDKEYDGTPDASNVLTLSLAGAIPGETASYSTYTGLYDDINCGLNIPITVTTITLNSGAGGFSPSNYNIDTYPITTGNIIKRGLTASIGSVTKEYDGNVLTGNITLTFTNLVGGETPLYPSYEVTFDDPNVGTNKGVTLQNVNFVENGAFNPTNYTFSVSGATSYTGTITAKSASVTPNIVSNKTYDGNTDATVSLNFDGLVQNEIPDYNCVASFNNKFAGLNKTVTITRVEYVNTATFKQTNYLLTFTNSNLLRANIVRKTLTYTIDSFSRPYDGTNTASPSVTFTGLVEGEVPNVVSDANYDTPNVGTGKTVTLNNFDINISPTFNPGNYDYYVDFVSANTGVIIPRVLIPSTTNITKEYDGTDTSNITLSYTNLVLGEIPIHTYTSKYNTKTAGLDKVITIIDIELSNTATFNTTNYSYDTTIELPNCVISAKPLTASVANVTTKEYDGTPDATITLNITGAVAPEEPSATYTASFNNANAGIGKQVTVNTINLLTNGIFDPSNYTIVPGQVSTATITHKPLTATITSVADKVYDGTTTASALLSVTGSLPGETPLWTNTATFNTPDVGTGKVVTVNNITLTDNMPFIGSNYSITAGQLTTGNITGKSLLFQITGVLPKVYDGTNVANLTHTVSGTIGAQVAKYTVSGSFDDANTGINKPLELNIVLLDDIVSGFLKNNYVVNATQVGTGTITPKPLTVTIRGVANKVYDGTTTATALLSVTGSIAGQTPLWTNTATFNNKTAGNNKLVTIRSITLRNNGAFIATNYRISVGQTKLANITKRLLRFKYVVKPRKYIKGNKKATMIFSAYNKLAADIVSISKYIATYNNDAISNSKPVTITKVILGGRDSANYYVSSKYTTKGKITK